MMCFFILLNLSDADDVKGTEGFPQGNHIHTYTHTCYTDADLLWRQWGARGDKSIEKK
jgi:hypothetical protein